MAKTKVVRGSCTVPGCDRPHKARGYCPAHLQRWMRGVEIAVPLRGRVAVPLPECKEDGCSSPVKARGLCHAHYAHFLRHGHTKRQDRKRPTKPCSVQGCANHLYAKGLCHRHYLRGRRLRAKFGVTQDDMDAILAKQNGACAICGGQPASVNGLSQKITDFHVDHCHVTNRVRGLLCSHCNRGIGLLQEDPAILRRAADYLETPPRS